MKRQAPEWYYDSDKRYGVITFPNMVEDVYLEGGEAASLDADFNACATDEARDALLNQYRHLVRN